MTGVLIEGRNIDTDKHRGSVPGEVKGRDQGDAPISQGMPRLPATPRSRQGGMEHILPL